MILNMFDKAYEVAENSSVGDLIKAEMPDDTHVHIVSNTGGNIIAMDNRAFGMNVEDENGIIECDEAIRVRDGLWISTARPYTLPAKFHYAWKRTETPPFYVQDWRCIPMLACYGVEIEPMDKNKSW